MAWKPYQDAENRGYMHILTTLFPEQAKPLPRFIVRSIIHLANLVGVAVLAFHWGILEAVSPKLSPFLIGAGVFLVFWQESAIWYAFLKIFR